MSSMLHRAAVGPFTDADAVTIDMLEAVEGEARDALIRPVAAGLAGVPELRLNPVQAAAVRHGNSVLLTGAGAPVAWRIAGPALPARCWRPAGWSSASSSRGGCLTRELDPQNGAGRACPITRHSLGASHPQKEKAGIAPRLGFISA